MGAELEDEELATLCNEIMDKVELLDGVESTKYGELEVHTKFGEPDFWKDKIPEIKKVIQDFLQTKKSKS
jgi:alpha/beta superfamily hydrolase